MKQTSILRIAGIISFLFVIFHLAFPLLPNWAFALKSMPDDYGAIFLTYHYILITFLAGMGYISTFQTKKLLDSPIKASVLLLFSSLFVIRIITEFVLWGITLPQSTIILTMCLLPLVCILSVLFLRKKFS